MTTRTLIITLEVETDCPVKIARSVKHWNEWDGREVLTKLGTPARPFALRVIQAQANVVVKTKRPARKRGRAT